ncbi:hypothetical protein [Devosia elaeis]|nr:hypothetical protein [Devosia elaeis]
MHDRYYKERRRWLVINWCLAVLIITAVIALIALDASLAPVAGGRS